VAKITLSDLTTLSGAAAVINENNAALKTAIDNTLSRDGTTPNVMQADLDMNSNQIINLQRATNPNDAATLQDVLDYSATIGAGLPSQISKAGQALSTDGTNPFWTPFPSGGSQGPPGPAGQTTANITTLRANNGTLTGPLIDVVGYYSATTSSAPDGGGGQFGLDSSDTTTADNGGTVIVDAGGKRWKRRFSGGEIDVRWFGARGSNSAAHASANTTAFQAALNFIAYAYHHRGDTPAPTPYGVLRVPSGIYYIDNRLTQTSTVYWKGDGKQTFQPAMRAGTTLYFTSTSAASGIYMDLAGDWQYGVANCSFDNIEFNCGNATSLTPKHAIMFKGGEAGGWMLSGTISRCQFNNWTGCALYWEVLGVGGGMAGYMQNMNITDCSCSNIGGFCGGDTYAGLFCTTMTIINFNSENATNISSGRRHAFFDFFNIRQVTFQTGVYEGTNSTSVAIRTGQMWTTIDNFHMEIDGTSPDYMFEVATNYGGQLQISNSATINSVTLKIAKFSESDSTTHSVIDFRNFLAPVPLSGWIEWSSQRGNRIRIRETNYRPTPSEDYLDRIQFENVTTGGNNSTNPAEFFFLTKDEKPLLSLQGEWLDKVVSGPVVLYVDSTGGADQGTVLSYGMKTDPTQGRVFELVSETNKVPLFCIYVDPLPEFIGNQITVSMRYYIESTQDTLNISTLAPHGLNNELLAGYGLSYNPAYNSEGPGPHNVWKNSWVAVRIPNTVNPIIICSEQLYGSATSPVGTTKLRIAGINVTVGPKIPYLIGGRNAAGAIKWRATAAPTYGTYIVGDEVVNSAPAPSGTYGWVCTTAGSPGTWKATGTIAA
jgi:hypothetical protein